MPLEIERKFLISGEPWIGYPGTFMQQGYLNANSECTIRVRTTNDQAWLTIKSRAVNFTRHEYEYSIPLNEAQELLANFCGNKVIAKTRYIVPYQGFNWEIDVFEGNNKGLIVAEIELESEEISPPLPSWIKEEVTYDSRYKNSCLLSNPWPFKF